MLCLILMKSILTGVHFITSDYFTNTGAMVRLNSFYGKVARPTVLSNVSCTGSEHTLQSCLHSTSGDCPMNENAGVQCPTVPVRCKFYYDNPLFNTCTCNSYVTSLVPLVYL